MTIPSESLSHSALDTSTHLSPFHSPIHHLANQVETDLRWLFQKSVTFLTGAFIAYRGSRILLCTLLSTLKLFLIVLAVGALIAGAAVYYVKHQYIRKVSLLFED